LSSKASLFLITFAPLMYTIHYTFEEKDKAPVTIENVEPGMSLLEVALLNKIDVHHNCGGVCACSTCHVYVNEGAEFVEEISDKEEDFVDRARSPKLSSRLSCQCVLLKGEGNVHVQIADQSIIQGE
jgi:ferredoxin, 2Fe-2S